METQRTIPQVSDAETTPSTPHFDNPHLSELPETTAAKPQPSGCFPPPEPPVPTPGLLDYSLGLLTGAALVLIIKYLTDDDTTTPTNLED